MHLQNFPFIEVNMSKPSEFDVLKSLIADQRAGAKDPNHPIHDRLKASLKAEAERLNALKEQKRHALKRVFFLCLSYCLQCFKVTHSL